MFVCVRVRVCVRVCVCLCVRARVQWTQGPRCVVEGRAHANGKALGRNQLASLDH
jgi:hypothetical protein